MAGTKSMNSTMSIVMVLPYRAIFITLWIPAILNIVLLFHYFVSYNIDLLKIFMMYSLLVFLFEFKGSMAAINKATIPKG